MTTSTGTATPGPKLAWRPSTIAASVTAGPVQCLDDALDLVVPAPTRWGADPRSNSRSATPLTAARSGEDRLEVHGLPDGRASMSRRQVRDHLGGACSARTPRTSTVSQQLSSSSPAHRHGRATAGRAGRPGPTHTAAGAPAGARASRQGGTAGRDPARQQVGQPVVEADLGVLVVRDRLARLGGQVAGARDQVRVVAQQHPAAGGGHDLVAVERQRGGAARTSRPAGRREVAPATRPRPRRARERRRRAASRDRCCVVGAPAEQVDGHDRGDVGALGPQRSSMASIEQRGVDVAASRSESTKTGSAPV